MRSCFYLGRNLAEPNLFNYNFLGQRFPPSTPAFFLAGLVSTGSTATTSSATKKKELRSSRAAVQFYIKGWHEIKLYYLYQIINKIESILQLEFS